MEVLFAAGCALRAYKPDLISNMTRFLIDNGLADGAYLTCCKKESKFSEETKIINCCPGCSRKFEMLGTDVTTVSLWKILLDTEFPFPNYHGEKMSIQDACHARNRNSFEMQEAARTLCERMNIEIVEPKYTRDEARCCGGCSQDSLVIRERMAKKRAEEFPQDNVVVYCTGCTRSLSITDVKPRHLLDLLFDEPTDGLKPKGWVD